MKPTKAFLCLLILSCSTRLALAAPRFWVSAASSNWNNTANWSATSGGTGGVSVPGSADDVTFDNTNAGNCVIDAAVSVTSITVSGYTGTISQGANTIAVSSAASFGSGTFTGGSANITIAGIFTLSGTAFTSTTAALELQNSAAFTGGAFTPNNGTVRFKTNVAVSTISGTSPSFYMLEFVGMGRSYTIASTGNISVANTLILSGTFFYNLNTGAIDVKGDLSVTNTATGNGGDALININGTGTQNFNGSTIAGAGALPQLTINKTSGTLNLSNFPGVSNNFTYIAGTVSAGTSTFCFTHGNIGAYTITGSLALANVGLIVNTGLLTVTIGAATTITAGGDLTLAGPGTLNINTGIIAVTGNILDNNTSTAGGGTGTILVNGLGAQSLTSTGVTDQGKLPAVTINKLLGTLTLPSLITVVGNWTYTAGLLDVTTNSSTVVFASNLTITGSHTLNNISFEGNNNYTFTTASATILTANGNMSITGGSNVRLVTGTISLNGNLNLTNTATGGGGSTILNFSGTTSQAIISSLAVNQSTLPAVTISKLFGTLTLPALITVNGNWTYTTGTLDVTTNNSTVIFAGTLGITGTQTLNNVTLQGNNNWTFTVNTGTLLTVTGALTTTGSSNVFINTPIAGATAIQAQGDVIINNTSVTGGGSALILFNGPGAQAFTSNAAASQGLLPYIRIQKTSGTLTMSGIISVSRDWTWVSGTVAPTTSSLIFGGNSLTITSAGMSFYNATITTNTATLANNLTVTNNLAITGSAILSPAANTINLGGSWTNWGPGGFLEAGSTVNFNGSALQTITSPGGENFTKLIVNNSSSGIQLGNGLAVATSLTMTQGNINLNTNTITLGTTALSPGTLAYTSGTLFNTGSFTRWFATSTIAAGGVAGLFPVGTVTDYRPINVSVPGAPTTGGTITVSYTDATTNTTSPTYADGASTIVVRKDLNWGMTTTTLAGGSYNLGIAGTSYGMIGNLTDLRLTLANTVTGSPGANAGTLLNPQVNRTGLTPATLNNTFYLGSINAVSSSLPVTLLSFSATVENSEVLLNWSTSLEINNSDFTVQRSKDGMSWENVAKVAGSGNSSNISYYKAYDPSPYWGASYYRLLQTDLDGKQTYSAIRPVNFSVHSSTLLFPNPAVDHVTLLVRETDKYEVALFNSNGQQMLHPAMPAGNTLTFSVSNLGNGVYFIHITRTTKEEVIKLVIKK